MAISYRNRRLLDPDAEGAAADPASAAAMLGHSLWWAGAARRHLVSSDVSGLSPTKQAMASETIAIASDHAGFELKETLKAELVRKGLSVLDLGTDGPQSVDYPDFAAALAEAMRDGRADRGVLVCGTGIGISIAANRHRNLRAALCHDSVSARFARQHNDANVLVLGARLIGVEVAKDCLEVFLKTPFEGGRHQRRVEKLS
jgi:ribose 5-phosphate isomerase B